MSDFTIIILYFTFTSLSTVGFGDYYPITDDERIVGAFLLLFGVAIFSYLMNQLLEVLESVFDNTEEFDEKSLDNFFSLLKYFNH